MRSILIAIPLVLACKSDTEKILEAHGSKLKPILEQVAALSPIADKAPKLTTETWPVPGVKWSSNIYTDPNGNAIWLWSHQLVDPCKHEITTYAPDNSGSDYIIFTQSHVSTAGDALRGPSCAISGKHDGWLNEKAVKYVEGVRYLLVLRPDVKVKPELDEAERKASVDDYIASGKSKDVEHFVPGRIAGDALLYELGTNKLLGGFTFDVKNGDEITIKDRGSPGYAEMQTDLAKRLEAVLSAKLSM